MKQSQGAENKECQTGHRVAQIRGVEETVLGPRTDTELNYVPDLVGWLQIGGTLLEQFGWLLLFRTGGGSVKLRVFEYPERITLATETPYDLGFMGRFSTLD